MHACQAHAYIEILRSKIAYTCIISSILNV